MLAPWCRKHETLTLPREGRFGQASTGVGEGDGGREGAFLGGLEGRLDPGEWMGLATAVYSSSPIGVADAQHGVRRQKSLTPSCALVCTYLALGIAQACPLAYSSAS